MFRPNQICQHSRKSGRNEYGEELYSDPVDIGFSPVRLSRKIERTSVRADSSATRGQADQTTTEAVILVDKAVTIGSDDRLVINGDSYRVVSVEKRTNVWGLLDHWEVGLEPLP